jgi:hypothetical protein
MSLGGYVWGQALDTSKSAFWWVTIAPVLLANSQSILLVALARAAFNLALTFATPFTAALRFVSPRSVLIGSSLSRGVVYALLAVLSWVDLQLNAKSALFVVLLALDGVLVSCSHTVDVDSGGVDVVARFLRVELDEDAKLRLFKLQYFLFESSILFFPLAVSALLLAFGVQNETLQFQNLSVSLALSSIFLLFGTVSSLVYLCGLRERNYVSLNSEPEEAPEINDGASLWTKLHSGYSEVKNNRLLLWRSVFLGLQSSFEDAFITVLVPFYAFYVLASSATLFESNENLIVPSYTLQETNHVLAFFWASCLISVGRLGTVFFTLVSRKYWNSDSELSEERNNIERHTFLPLLKYSFLAKVSALAFPGALYLWTQKGLYWESQAFLFVGYLLFCVFSAAPKLGLQQLLHNSLQSSPNPQFVLGFVGVFTSLLNAVLLFSVSAVFYWVPRVDLSLQIVSGFIASVGFLEFLFSPCLTFTLSNSDNAKHQEKDQADNLHQGGYQLLNSSE